MIKGGQYKLRNGVGVRFDSGVYVEIVSIPKGFEDDRRYVGEHLRLSGLKKKYLSGGAWGSGYDVVGEYYDKVGENSEVIYDSETTSEKVEQKEELNMTDIQKLHKEIHEWACELAKQISEEFGGSEVSGFGIIITDTDEPKVDDKENRDDDTFSQELEYNSEDDEFTLTITNDRTEVSETSKGESVNEVIDDNEWSDKLPTWFGEEITIGWNIAYIFNKIDDADYTIDDWGRVYKVTDEDVEQIID